VLSGFGGLGVSVMAFTTQVRGFKPGRSRRIFKDEKILSTPSFGGEVKPSVPCRRFAAWKKSLNIAWKSTFRQNYRTFLAHSVPRFATFSGLQRRPENVTQLTAHIVKLCRALSEDLCRKVVTKARVRLQEVVRQNGGHIEHVLH